MASSITGAIQILNNAILLNAALNKIISWDNVIRTALTTQVLTNIKNTDGYLPFASPP